MRRTAGRRLGALVSLSVVAFTGTATGLPTAAASPAPARVHAASPIKSLGRVELPRPVRGATAIRLLGDQFDEAAALNDVTEADLVDLLRTDPTAWVDRGGAVFFKDESARAPAEDPVSAEAPLAQTFLLHSKPDSQRTIYLDFDGGAASGTAWHASYAATPTTQPAWDPSGNGAAFDSAELTKIQTIWQSVAEDFAPFDVDVTTADPGTSGILRTSAGDPAFGSHVLVTPSAGATDAICGGCGGVAYLNVFDTVNGNSGGAAGDGYGYMQPAWVFPQQLGNSPKNIAEAVSHEVGHNVGLSHDANATQGYDEGHGAWAPIMGVGYNQPISQWSQGDYDGADNPEDDVAKIRSVIGARADEAGTGIAGAPAVPAGPAHISTRTDVDTYLLGTCSGSVNVDATPESFANLDIQITLRDATGQAVATANPVSARTSVSAASGMSASLTRTVASGTYYVSVDGVGNGPWSTGYDDYGSLGAYTLTAAGCNGAAPIGAPSAPTSTAATPHTADPTVGLAWAPPTSAGSSAVTGYVLTRSGNDVPVQVAPATTSYVWTGLDAGTAYSFTVTALNAQGPGPSARVDATTAATTPSAPRNLTGRWDSLGQRALFGFSAPASSGGTAVTSYDLFVDGVHKYAVSSAGTWNLPLTPGTYTLGVAAVNGTGRGAVANATLVVAPRAANDAFAQRATLAGVTGTINGDNLESTAEAGEPSVTTPLGPGPGNASVWYSWTAPTSGLVTMTTTSSVPNRDTTLGVYVGPAMTGLVKVGDNDDRDGTTRLSALTFTATAGTTYQVAVDGYRGFAAGVGAFTLTWAGTAGSTSNPVDLPVPPPLAPPVAPPSTPPVTPPAPATVPTTAVTPPTTIAASTTEVVGPRKAKVGSRPAIKVSVLRGTTAASGKVTITVGKKATTLTLKAGTATLKLPRARAGKLKITVRYLGDAATATSSTTRTIKVKPA